MMLFLTCYDSRGSALSNDHAIIQLTTGGEINMIKEQQEPELATPEIPRDLIGYELIGDTDASDGEDYLSS